MSKIFEALRKTEGETAGLAMSAIGEPAGAALPCPRPKTTDLWRKEIAIRVVVAALVPRECALPVQAAQAATATEKGQVAGVGEPGCVRDARVGEDRLEVARATAANRAVGTRVGAMRMEVVPARDEHVDIAGRRPTGTRVTIDIPFRADEAPVAQPVG